MSTQKLVIKPLKNTVKVNKDDEQLAQQYQAKTDIEHILHNPDTYIGSVENVDASMWVFDDATKKIVLRDIEYIPGLYKLFDEGIVNCRDHVIRMIQSPLLEKKFVTHIDTNINEDGTITMSNDGNGIDIAKHPVYDIWIPEMIFGHLRTSTNYNKEEKKIVGGKNGFGFKLVLIWSDYGKIETVDHIRGLKYVQEFKRNLDEICPPTITKVSTNSKPYTKVTFKPDYRRLGVQGLTSDMLALLKKRVYDIGAVTDHSIKKIKVNYNDETIPVKNFQQYIDLYIGTKEESKRVYEQSDERWEYAVAMSPTHEFMQVSFVNGICTFKGGKHIDYITGQIVRKLCDYIEKKKKIKVNSSAIKEQLILFLRCDIENPSFDSQTKDFMNTPSNKFGSSCTVSDSFIEKVAKMGVMDLAMSLTEAKENKLAKKTDGSKTKTIRGIANFIDANHSGTSDSKDCILILCEGLSAMSGIVSGLSSSDKNTIGIYPLKGKLLNVRGQQIKKISENKEISDLKKILGLETGKAYATLNDIHKNLRYGKVMFMTDQDLDGSHIKGLCINLFHSEWSTLTKIPGFLCFMNTPILRAKKGATTKLFYNDGEYMHWKESLGQNGGTNGWTIKYFKGLGTSTAAEFKEYFANKKIVDFVHSGQISDDSIDKVFNKERADDRKTWLEQYDKNAYLDTNRPNVQYENFMNQEMIHFSTYDCARSIPNMVDGLKISLRKILFSAFKRKLTSEIKVAQFSGYVSEHSAYHHGEASLNGAIVNMAQNFVGSNNINLLEPNGQFGTRLHGGDDSASERYIFTMLNSLTRYIFPEADDTVLNYLNDDGTIVEPEFYVPILPFALVNGISGIGTGFSCSIAPYDPAQLIQYLKLKLSKKDTKCIDFVPYYEGFKGSIQKIAEQKYLIKGCYEKLSDDKIRITELPVGTWTMPYTTFLETLMDGSTDKAGKKVPPTIKDFTSISTEVAVDFTVVFPKGKIQELEATLDANGCNGLEKLLKLFTTVSSTNMHMFNSQCKLHKYTSVEEVIDDFYGVRMDLYKKRKDYLVKDMEKKLVKLSNRARYIQETLKGTVDLRRKKADEVTGLLTGLGFDLLDGDYKYLIKMPMDSVTEENVASIMKEKTDTEAELEALKAKTLEQMWLEELDALEKQYDLYKKKRVQIQEGTIKPSTQEKKKKFTIKK
uniref:DNA topoisomerase (ATP-hydrolyzing) n=1 Tax=viral metagenome TaxID=1070528 RepID=A0A6C0JMP1_9ZZZZ